jgi:hypothetical protein
MLGPDAVKPVEPGQIRQARLGDTVLGADPEQRFRYAIHTRGSPEKRERKAQHGARIAARSPVDFRQTGKRHAAMQCRVEPLRTGLQAKRRIRPALAPEHRAMRNGVRLFA